MSTPLALWPPLPRDFYARDTIAVARELLGMQLIRATREGLVRGRIVETEAYLPTGDSACHAARGKTRKNAAMFGRPGIAYVYAIHSRWCFNVVTEAPGTPAAVLIRALEPLQGAPLMQRRRGDVPVLDTTRGPARLCEAFAIDKRMNQWSLTSGRRLWIARDETFEGAGPAIGVSPRIGVTSAEDLPLRFTLVGNVYLSRRDRNQQTMEVDERAGG